ncbi:MAG: RNA pseudouridine synthase, partial [Clostridia bacterium]|nr:RNA pseudouridine synthase [Clostridia bacterium]
GRTHQIRVHMSSLGHPVLGDEVYGGDKHRAAKEHAKYISGQCLHAYRLELDHPRTGERMSFEAPLPAEMAHLIEIFRQEL